MMDKAYSLVIKSMERMRKETEGAQSRSEGESGPLSLLSPPPPPLPPQPPLQTSVNPPCLGCEATVAATRGSECLGARGPGLGADYGLCYVHGATTCRVPPSGLPPPPKGDSSPPPTVATAPLSVYSLFKYDHGFTVEITAINA